MAVNLVVKDRINMDLNMYQCGEESCESGHHFGPAVRDHYLIHYVFEGQGIFKVNDKLYDLKSGQGFLICPNVVTYYQADTNEPWYYAWVGFHGLKAEEYLKQAGLTEEQPVFTYNRDGFIRNCLNDMISTKELMYGRELRWMGLLYMFLSELIETLGVGCSIDNGTDRKEMYIKKALEFIEMNYSRKVSINEMADYIALDRSYLSTIFKDRLGISPKNYLIEYRINKACNLMRGSHLSIADIARSVGYDDQLLFSKMFKKIRGISPSEHRIKAK